MFLPLMKKALIVGRRQNESAFSYIYLPSLCVPGTEIFLGDDKNYPPLKLEYAPDEKNTGQGSVHSKFSQKLGFSLLCDSFTPRLQDFFKFIHL